MTFTYDIESTDANTLVTSQIRLEAGDSTIEPRGIRPEGRNFTDHELTYFYEAESSNVGRAAARAVETAATEWSTVALNMRIGEHWEAGAQAANLQRRAKALRELHGFTPGKRPTYSVQYANARPSTDT